MHFNPMLIAFGEVSVTILSFLFGDIIVMKIILIIFTLQILLLLFMVEELRKRNV